MNLKVLRTQWRYEKGEVNCMYSYLRHLDVGECSSSRLGRVCLLNGRVAGVQSQFLGNVSWVTMKWVGKDMEVTVAYFKALAWRFPGGTEEKLQRISGISVVLMCPVGL